MTEQSIRTEEKEDITFLYIENDSAKCKLSLYGGHVMSFIPKSDNRDRLWLSPLAFLNGDRPIRGGIPLCWPWFSDDHGREKGELPSHGFLRTQQWHLTSSDCDGKVTTVTLAPQKTTGKGFDVSCDVYLHLTIADTLTVVLETINTDSKPFKLNCALHTYFAVSNIKQVELEGLSGDYKDKLEDWAIKPTPEPYLFSEETDRIHLNAPELLKIKDDGAIRTTIKSQNHDSIVVWNPWQGAASISDMDAFGYRQMLCVETAVTQGLTLEPGAIHQLTQQIG